MENSHTPPLPFAYASKTKARWAREPKGKLLILVHGFNGSATDTWAELPGLLRENPAMAGHDIICYGYNSLKYNASTSADALHGFINKLLQEPAKHINVSLAGYEAATKREAAFAYQELYLVGHSLGACVIRRALLNELIGGKQGWPQSTKIIFYAPAHGGASILRLWTAATLGLPLGRIKDVSSFWVPSLKNLEQGSPFLKKLQDQTMQLVEKHRALKAPLTFWAEGDRIVENEEFASDVMPVHRVERATHISICKPLRGDIEVTKLIKEIAS